MATARAIAIAEEKRQAEEQSRLAAIEQRLAELEAKLIELTEVPETEVPETKPTTRARKKSTD